MKNVVSLALIALLIVGCDERDKSKHETQQPQQTQPPQDHTSSLVPFLAGAMVGTVIGNNMRPKAIISPSIYRPTVYRSFTRPAMQFRR